jgi:hypothetical protein
MAARNFSMGTITGSYSSGLTYHPKFGIELYGTSSLYANIDATFNNWATFNSKVFANSTVEIYGKTEIYANTDITGNVTITGKLTADNIGTFSGIEYATSKTISTATLTKIVTVTLNKGVWVLSGKAQLSSNIGTSVLQAGIGTNTTSTNILSGSITTSNKVCVSTILNISSDNTDVYLYAYQNSGSDKTISAQSWLRAVQIK